MASVVLVVAAHPDDEVLGMGGTIAKHVTMGDAVKVLFLADGISSRNGANGESSRQRQAAAGQACALLGAQIVGQEAFPDNAFDSVPLLTITRVLEQAKEAVRPNVVYTHHAGDLNIDHRVTNQAVLTAFRPQPEEAYSELLAFEVNSSTAWAHPTLAAPFAPDTFVDISSTMDTLLKAYRFYVDEVRPMPHQRSVEALRVAALYRGHQVGLHAAEAFVTLRRIVRGTHVLD